MSSFLGPVDFDDLLAVLIVVAFIHLAFKLNALGDGLAGLLARLFPFARVADKSANNDTEEGAGDSDSSAD